MLRFILFLLIASGGLGAQSVDYGERGWQLSLTVGDWRFRQPRDITGVSAADTMTVIRGTRTFRPRPIDTLLLADGPIVYYVPNSSLPTGDDRTRQLIALVRLQAHRRYPSGMEFGIGFAYDGYTDDDNFPPTGALPTDYFYSRTRSKSRYYALSSTVTYNFRKRNRLQPYAGLLMTFGINFFDYLGGEKVYPIHDTVLPADPIAPRFRQQTIFDWDTDILAGVNYWLSPRFSVGVEAAVRSYLLPVPRAFQLRYRLGANRETDDRR